MAMMAGEGDEGKRMNEDRMGFNIVGRFQEELVSSYTMDQIGRPICCNAGWSFSREVEQPWPKEAICSKCSI